MPSTSVASRFRGMVCAEAINYSLVHGSSPGVANATLSKQIVPPLGSLQIINLGGSVFVGYVIGHQYDPMAETTDVQMVDWRDRLHDDYLRCAWNMQEEDGRLFHMLPDDWRKQRRTYVTKELGQLDFQALQILPDNAAFQLNIAKNTLFSAATLLNWIGKKCGFVITAERLALQKLRQSYPLNLDFNNGTTKIATAIDSILQKCGLQSTCFGYNNMHITIRGYSENAFANALLAGLANLCLLGVSTGKIGQELNERGRRVSVVGERNKYEFVFPCRANWNSAWTWGMVYNGIELGALLKRHNLTLDSKVRELPDKYHDDETWADNDNGGEGALPARKTRNDMTIRDYLEKVAYKIYVVDAGHAVVKYAPVVEDKFDGKFISLDRDELEASEAELKRLRDFLAIGGPGAGAGMTTNELLLLAARQIKFYPRSNDWNLATYNFLYPLSRSLVSDSNLQYVVYATTRNIIRGADHPFGVQNSFVPRSQGVGIETEEVVNPTTGESEYRVRVAFNQPQFWNEPDKDFDDPTSVSPDMVLVRLSLDADYFIYQQGEKYNNVRVREQVVSVRNLYNSYINLQLMTTLRENFRRDLKKGGQALGLQPVSAEEIAKRIATQVLAHAAVSKSGTLNYQDICGTTPDGLVDSVNVSFSAEAGAGISETVNLTTGLIAETTEAPVSLRVSRKFNDEEELAKERLRVVALALTKDKKALARTMAIMDTGLHEPGALVGVPTSALAYGKEGIVSIEFKKELIEILDVDAAWKGGSLIVFDKHTP